MRKLLPIAFLLIAFCANAVDRITSTVIVTNAPIGNTNKLTVNASTRSFTNSVTGSPATLIQETNSVPWTATNILNQLTSYRVSQFHFLGQNASNTVRIVGDVGEALAVSITGNWGYVTNSTQTVISPTIGVRVPLTVERDSNRVLIASYLVQGLSDGSSNAFSANSTAVSNLVNLYSNQTVAGNKTFTGTNALSDGGWNRAALTNTIALSGIVSALTNGYATNLILGSPITTNLVNRGNAISSPGTNGANSEQFGTGAIATNSNSTAVGASAQALGASSTALGSGSIATDGGDMALGSGSFSEGGNAMAWGVGAEIHGTNGIAIGRDASVNHANSVVIGPFAGSTDTNQITLGTTSHTTTVPGVFAPSGTLTNLTIRGTNVLNGRLDFTSRANTGLANGNNSGVILGTNVYIRLSGATTIAALAGFAAEQDGSWHIVQISGSVTNTILNESGVDATAANRILTGTGGDVSFTNQPTILYMHYDAAAARWRLRLDR